MRANRRIEVYRAQNHGGSKLTPRQWRRIAKKMHQFNKRKEAMQA